MPAVAHHLKRLTATDIDRLLELDRACLGGFWSRQGFEDEFRRPPRDPARPDFPSSIFLGACASNGSDLLMGFAGLWALGAEAHVITLGVHPDYRRQGMGRALVEALLQEAILQGLEWATLEVRASNVAARQLYQSLGFTQLGERLHYYTNPIEDALVLWKRLQPAATLD
ncbi:MAG: ribosomal protein S18-alanine N-acetyltransferase [Cyanobacteria bacterium J06642_2]